MSHDRITVRVGGGFAEVRSDCGCKHRLRLTKDHCTERPLPPGHDLLAVRVVGTAGTAGTAGLEELSLEIGCQAMLSWHRAVDLDVGVDLLGRMLRDASDASDGLPMSRCPNMHVDLVLRYDERRVRAEEGWESEDEYEDAVAFNRRAAQAARREIVS